MVKPDSELLYDAFKACPLGIAIENLEGQPLFVNSALCAMLGLSEEEMLGKHCVEFSPPEDAAKDWALFEQLRAGSIDHYQIDKRFFRRDGSTVWGRLSICLLKGATPPMVVAMVEDITEKKKAEKALFRYAAIVESSDDAITGLDTNGTITNWNKGAERLFGYSASEAIGENILFLSKADARDDVKGVLKKAWQGEVVKQHETVRRRKDGTSVEVSLTVSPIVDAGQTVGASEIARDITKRKRAEDAIRESEKRYRRIVETTNEGVWLLDLNLHTWYVNRQMGEMLGYEPGEMVGRSVFDFYFPEDVEHKRQALTRRKQGVREEIEERLRRRDGSELWVRMAATPVFKDSGEFDGAMAMVSDVTERKAAEEALSGSEARLRLAAEVGKMYAYEWDIATDMIMRSPAYVNILGATEPRTLTHQQVMEKIHPDDRSKLAAAAARHSPESPTVDVTYRVLLPGKSPVWVKSSGRAFFDEEGRMLRVIGMVADITDQKMTEEALLASEERLRLGQKVARIGAFERNIRTGVNTWTAEMESMYGLPPGGFGQTRTAFENLVHPDDRAGVVELVNGALRTGQPTEGEWRVIWPDGSVHWIAGRWQVVMHESGEPSRVVGVNIDITERKQAEETLRESEEKFRSVFHNAGVGMVIVSPEGRYLAANKTFCDSLGYAEEELQEKTVESVTLSEDWPVFAQKLSNALTEGHSFQWVQKRCLHKSGRIVYTESSASVIRSCEGHPQYFVGEVLDITKRKEAEEALSGMTRKLVEAQEQERARIARELHDDINQRLAMLAVQLEQVQNDPSEIQRRVSELRKQTTEISNGVQALSHDLHSSQLEYLGVVAGMKNWCKEFGERQGMQIDCRQDVRSTPPQEIGLCLFRVLQEALHNAAKHSGVKRIEVQLHEESDEIHLTIRDLGKGFDVEAAKKGRGLGLTSMQERVRLVRGTIEIQSKPMGGTSMHVRVPLRSGHASQRAAG